jgi:hypothetical protein
MSNVEEKPNADASRFFDLLKDSDEPLWDGFTESCQTITSHAIITDGYYPSVITYRRLY